jgi:hypothetical protein
MGAARRLMRRRAETARGLAGPARSGVVATTAAALLVGLITALPASAVASGGVRGLGSVSPATSATSAASGTLDATFGTAEETPGTAALNKNGFALTTALSCPSAGNCAAGGWASSQAFVVDETNGSWDSATPIADSLDPGGADTVYAVSCPSAGNCLAGGYMTDGSGGDQAFVVAETNGNWGTADEVPGTATLNTGDVAATGSVSCSTTGNCTVAGNYSAGGTSQPFVADEVNGTWQTAVEVPGITQLENGSFNATLASLSCGSAGNCTVGGTYEHGVQPYLYQAFVADEVDGTWQDATDVPGIAALNVNNNATVESVSCASAGNCSAGGNYLDDSYLVQAFVVTEAKGVWGQAEEVPGFGALNPGGQGGVTAVSCASPGNCSAGGDYASNPETSATELQAFVVDEVNGTWGQAEPVPGLGSLNAGASSDIDSVSCSSAGNCGAGGYYVDSSGHNQAFAVTEENGTWQQAAELPGTATLNAGGNAEVAAVACGSPGSCVADGEYTDNSGASQSFVTSSAVCTAANPGECLLASNAAYGLDSGTFAAPSGMTELDSVVQASDGYAAVALLDSAGNIIIANEGAQIAKPDERATAYQNGSFLAVAQIFLGHAPAALTDAVNFARTVAALPQAAGKKIFVTGHDIGGVEAEAQAAMLSSLAGGVTFGASGLPLNTSPGTSSNLVNLVDAGDPVGLWASDVATLKGVAPEDMDHYGSVQLIGPDTDARFADIAEKIARNKVSELLEKVADDTVELLPEKYKATLGAKISSATTFASRYNAAVAAAEYSFLGYAVYHYHGISVYAADLSVNLNPLESVPPEADAAEWYASQFDSKLTGTELTQIGDTGIAASGDLKAPDISLAPEPDSATIKTETYSIPASDSSFDVSYNPAEKVSSVKVDDESKSYEIFNDDSSTHSWSSSVEFYARRGEAGKVTGRLYNWHSGGSQLQLFTGLPAGVREQIRNYSRPDATGRLISVHNSK